MISTFEMMEAVNSTINSSTFHSRDISNTSETSNFKIFRTLTIAQMIIYVILGALILIGNSLCLAAFLKTKTLQKRSYYLLISLSIADFLVGISATVICVEDGLSLFYGKKNVLFSFWRDVAQYFPRMCSLFTIATVAVERYWAVGYPTKHRAAGTRPYVVLVAFPWVLAAGSSSLFVVSGRNEVFEKVFNVVDVALSQATLLTIIIAYCGLLKKMKTKTISKKQRSVVRERKLAVTLFVVTLASVITIYPVNIYFLVEIFYKNLNVRFSKHFLIFLIALASSNSGINIVVYILRIPEFKNAIYKLVFRKRNTSRIACSSQLNDIAESVKPDSLKKETS